jgi:hypothetical protein
MGKRAYVLTGPKSEGVVIFGNDYKLTFNDDNTLKEKKWIHKSLIPIKYGTDEKGRVTTSAMHTHLPETGSYFTATDICTLMLYGKFTPWQSHMIVSGEKISTWQMKGGPAPTEKGANGSKKKKR